MDDINKLCEYVKEQMLDSAPDIWQRLKKSIDRYTVEQLINELKSIPSNYSK